METSFTARGIRWVIVGALGWLGLLFLLLSGHGSGSQLAAAPTQGRGLSTSEASGLAAFGDVASVLRSPRCINCHPAGDVPRQTDLQQPHFPAVARGPDGHGVTGMRCTACHQEENQPNGIPGAPNWGLAPLSMAWVGLDDHALAEQLKDPNRNGHRTLAQLIEHVSSERLVLWAWLPGGDRRAPPLTHEQFVERFKAWVAAGAPSPKTPKE